MRGYLIYALLIGLLLMGALGLGLGLHLRPFGGGTYTPPAPAIPVITSSSITGTPEDGQTLTANRTVTGFPSPTITYQWQASAVNIGGQTAQTILLDAAAMGLVDAETISCEITATNASGSDTDEPTIAFVGEAAAGALATPTLIEDTGGLSGDNRPLFDINANALYPDGIYLDDTVQFQWGLSEAAAAAMTPVGYVFEEAWVLDDVDPSPELVTFARAQAPGAVVSYRIKGIGGAHRTGANIRSESAWSNFLAYTVSAAPALSAATADPDGADAMTGSVSTTQGNGMLYWFISTSATPPSASDLKAGVGSTAFGAQAVSASGTQNIASGGLPDATDLYVHFIHTNNGGDSNIVTSPMFTTAAATPTKTVFLGDSITAPAGTYARQFITANPAVNPVSYAHSGMLLGNSGQAAVPQPTAANMWPKARQAIIDFPTDTILFCILPGANDDYNPSDFPERVLLLADYVRSLGHKMLVISAFSRTDTGYEAYNDRRDAAIPIFRAAVGTRLDAFYNLAGDPRLSEAAALASTDIRGDGLHPGALAHTIALAGLTATLLPLYNGATATSPTAFSFADATGQVINTVVSGNPVFVTGMDPAVSAAVTATGGTAAVGNSGYSTAPGSIYNGDTLWPRVTTGTSDGTSYDVVVSAGATSDTFSATTTAVSSYTAQSVRFDGTDRLARGAALTGVSAGKAGTLSFWLNMKASGFGPFYIFARSLGTGVRLERSSSNKITLVGANSAPATILTIRTSGTFTDVTGWAHVMMSWDLATGRAQCYVNGVSAIDGAATIATNDTINYGTPDFGIGATSSSPAGFLDGDIADLYVNMAASLDLSVQTNREKFILAGRPVDLGATGNLPTGSAPAVFLAGAAANWHTNKGAGGGFTLTGTLVAGTDNP